MKRLVFALSALAGALTCVFTAHAGQSCNEKALTQTSLHSGMAIAQQVQAQLSRSNAVVALVGRIGMDLSEYKVTSRMQALLTGQLASRGASRICSTAAVPPRLICGWKVWVIFFWMTCTATAQC